MWVKKLLKSFHFALEGLKYTVMTQRNMRIHFLIALLVLGLSLYFPLSKLEVLVIFISIVLVLFAELINTSIESVVDMVTEEYHPLAKIAKDVAAAAVLLTAGLAFLVGISIYFPYINMIYMHVSSKAFYVPDIGIVVILAVDFFLTLLIKAGLHRMGKELWEPSMATSLSFCAATLLVGILNHLPLTFLVIFLMLIFLIRELRQKEHPFPVFWGAVLGVGIAILGFYWL